MLDCVRGSGRREALLDCLQHHVAHFHRADGQHHRTDIERQRADAEAAKTSVFAQKELPTVESRDVVVGGEELAKLESDNCGKPYSAALNDEIPAIADVFRFFAGASRCMSGSAGGEYLPGHTSMIRRDPVGVIASIAPWNYPLMMMAWKLCPAIGGGNTVVFKPSEMTPKVAEATVKLWQEAGLPAGVLNLVQGEVLTGKAVAAHPELDGLFFTAVKSTGIYCRPICPARLPAESQVSYYPTAASAAAAA